MWILIAVAVVSLVLGLFPMMIAHPLVEQTPAMLSAAYWIRTAGPWVSVVLAVTAATMAWRFRRLWALLLAAPPFAFVYTSRVQFAEWFFPPARDAQWAETTEDLGAEDLVIGVTLDGEARAYPVRYLAFHHMVNDVMGRTHLLPTY